jgi:hypothetical protein
MARCRFVQPDVVRLTLSDGDWIDVKKELNAGESRKVFTRLVKAMHFNEKAEVDPDQVGLSKVVEFLVGWSLVDAQGKPVPVSEAAINNLDSATYAEVVKVIDAHEAAGDATREALKNEKGDENKSLAISSSVN